MYTALEFAFQLHAQGYDFYFSHGTSNSAGVCMAIRYALGVNVVKLVGVPGRLLVLNLSKDNETLHILNVYTPNDAHDRKLFFLNSDKMIMDCCMVLGDFNSVTDVKDHLSRHLDSTSSQLRSLLFDHSLEEPRDSHTRTFTYHHPSISQRKSRLDYIYVNYPTPWLIGYIHYVTFSDHYLVSLTLLKPEDLGPRS